MGVKLPGSGGYQPRKLRTQYFTKIQDALHAVEAATTLGLGIVLRNQLELGRLHSDEGTYVEGWLLDILEDVPEVNDDDEPGGDD